MLAFPGFQMIWDITRDGFSPAFRELVEKLIAEVNEGDSYTINQKWQQLALQRKTDRRPRDTGRPTSA
jgi:hypothetical protein